MKNRKLDVCWVDMKYIRNLHNKVDERVYSVSPQSGKPETIHLQQSGSIKKLSMWQSTDIDEWTRHIL